jgi:excinuclease ABC subunit C
MLRKASSVEFILTPSDRDALVLESKLIKYHQPPFNVLLKDDEHYPYICASVGDAYPRFSIVPRREERSVRNSRYRYFGPYTSFQEINAILEGIEAKYDLRSQSFIARHGDGTKEDYQKLFNRALTDVFSGKRNAKKESLRAQRAEYEEASTLFDSKYNECRDVVAIAQIDGQETTAVVHVLQLRQGLVAGRFSYSCQVPLGLREDEDFAYAIQSVLEKQHYPSGEEAIDSRFSWFPDEILISHTPIDAVSLKKTIAQARKEVEGTARSVSISIPATKGPRHEVDARALEFALENAQQVAHERMLGEAVGSQTALDGTAAAELAEMLALEKAPTRIECYDISHTQGEFAVGSRVVFIDGKPAPEFYRKFNIRTVEGVDDYASLEEVIERRFRRAWINGVGGPVDKDSEWGLPCLVVIDGGPGQLGAAIRGMSKAKVFPSPLQKVSVNGERHTGANRAAHVAICALAKSEERIYVHGQKEPINDSSDSAALLLLRALRDESHRFALQAHRRRRSILKSSKQ